MLAGLLAALVPVMLHLLSRVRAPVVLFPTLRFLKITAQKTARRRQVQQYFLLLVRVIVFAMVALAVATPLIRGGSAGLAYGFVGLLMGGLALLILAGVWSAAAMDRSRDPPPPAPSPASEAATTKQSTRTPSRLARRYWALSAAALLTALFCAGFSVFGLGSDRFFSGAGGGGEFTGASTAMVIVLDNSYSMLARDGNITHLASAKQQVRQMLGDTPRPAMAAILPTNPGEQSATSTLTADMTRLAGSLETLAPSGRALPMQERVRTAVELLGESAQPNKMLVIITDFARPAFSDAAVFTGIRESTFRKDLQVVFMPMGSARTVGAGPDGIPATQAGAMGAAGGCGHHFMDSRRRKRTADGRGTGHF